MRTLSALIAAATLSLTACQTGEAPVDVEPTPAPDAAVGTESGGAVVGEADGAVQHFGAAFTVETTAVKAVDLLADPSSYVSEDPILIEGTVVDVCQKAGCWMVLSDGSKTIRVTVKDHGFAVAKDSTGSWARVQGRLEAIDDSPETVAHLEGESERPDLMPEKAGATYQFVATGVEFKNG